MPSLNQQLDSAFRAAISAAFGIDADPLIAPAQNPQFGDYQSNAAMGLAKRLAEQTGQKTNPRQVAEQIKAKLDLGAIASEVSIAGPGFINVRLDPAYLAQTLSGMLADDRLGVQRAAHPQVVVIDYSAPNVAKEMHVGHLRSTIMGDCYARLLAFLGHVVVRQNHIGDWGTQFGRVMLGLWYDAVARADGATAVLDGWMSTAMRIAKGPDDETPDARAERHRQQVELLAQVVPWHQAAIDSDIAGDRIFKPYLDDAFPSLARLQTLYQFTSAITDFDAAKGAAIRHTKYGDRTLDTLPSFIATFVQRQAEPGNEQEGVAWRKSIDSTMAACQSIYTRLGTLLTPADVRGESFYNPLLPGVVKDLKDAGIAEVSDGATVVFVPGFEAPLMVQKSDGGYGYGTTDLAAVRYRLGELNATRVIYVVGSPQAQHFEQVFWTARKAGWANEHVQFEHAKFGSVLGEDGKLLRTRAGGTVRLVDLIDEAEERAFKLVSEKSTTLSDEQKQAVAHAVGIGALKYFDLLRDRIGDYKFSFDAMLSMDGNTAPYLQYAHARIRSIFRRAEAEIGPAALSNLAITHLNEPQEKALAKVLLRFAETVEAVARELKPHFLCAYLYELAGAYSVFYDNCPVLRSDEPIRSSRLALCALTARTLAVGLDLLGIGHPEQM